MANLKYYYRPFQIIRLTLVILTILTIFLLFIFPFPPKISRYIWSKFGKISEFSPEAQLPQLNYSMLQLLQSFQYVPECACFRERFYPMTRNTNEVKRLDSTCSDTGTYYAPKQKVISYSMYFSNRTKYKWMDLRFQKGLQENLILLRKYYPSYSIRLYTNVNLTKNDEYCKILCENPELFWCDIRHSPSIGNQQIMYFRMWRFFALGDESVDHFLSRDIDSYITARESDAVTDWLQHHTGKSIHVMRDYKDAHDLAILAGMWGASNTRLGLPEARRLRKNVFHQHFPNQSQYPTFFDQVILTTEVFFRKRKTVLAHDSYHCTRWRNWTRVRPFPKQRRNEDDFVGNYVYMKLNVSSCPVACRPKYGRDWEYC